MVVDPPQWGDRIHSCRKEYTDNTSKLAVRDGDVLIRAPGQTRQATSYDLEQLELRRSEAPHTGANVRVSYAGHFDRTSRSNVHDLIAEMVDSAADELVGSLPEPAPRSLYSTGIQALLEQTSGSADRRSPDEFRADVEKWHEDCREALPDVATEFLRHTLEHGTFVIENESDRYLENVRVQVTCPTTVTVLMASDTEYCDHGGQFEVFQMLPDRPARYGDLKPYGLGGFLLPRIDPVVPNLPAPSFDVEQTSEGYIVSWYVGDLPPRARIVADEQFAVFSDENLNEHNHDAIPEGHQPMSTEVGAPWQVTARGVDHVFQGELAVECRQEPGAVAMWARH